MKREGKAKSKAKAIHYSRCRTRDYRTRISFCNVIEVGFFPKLPQNMPCRHPAAPLDIITKSNRARNQQHTYASSFLLTPSLFFASVYRLNLYVCPLCAPKMIPFGQGQDWKYPETPIPTLTRLDFLGNQAIPLPIKQL